MPTIFCEKLLSVHDVDTAMSNFYLKIDTARQFHEKKNSVKGVNWRTNFYEDFCFEILQKNSKKIGLLLLAHMTEVKRKP